MSRTPLSDQERSQVKALLRFLMFVLLAIAFASLTVGALVSLFGGDPTPLALTPTP